MIKAETGYPRRDRIAGSPPRCPCGIGVAVAIRDRQYRFRTSDLAGRDHLASAQTDQLFTFFFEKRTKWVLWTAGQGHLLFYP
jgi:hypothetical protein